MRRALFLVGALLSGAPLFCQLQSPFDPGVKEGKLVWFQLGETREEVSRIAGPPHRVATFGDFISWQYFIGEREDEEASHFLVFRKSDGRLLSVTRSFEHERDVAALFPATETAIHTFHGEHGEEYPVAVRKLDRGRLLLAMGFAKPADPVRQVTLIRADQLQYFHSWLHRQLEQPAK